MSRSSITGKGLKELDALIAHLGGLGGAVHRALRVAAPKIQAKCRAGYAKNVGPDGMKWKRNVDGTYPSLSRPAALVTFEADGDSLVGRGEDVLQYHQDGNDRLPRRAVFPEDGTLPASWEPILEAAFRKEVGEKK